MLPDESFNEKSKYLGMFVHPFNGYSDIVLASWLLLILYAVYIHTDEYTHGIRANLLFL